MGQSRAAHTRRLFSRGVGVGAPEGSEKAWGPASCSSRGPSHAPFSLDFGAKTPTFTGQMNVFV